jgi:hypothetical protein
MKHKPPDNNKISKIKQTDLNIGKLFKSVALPIPLLPLVQIPMPKMGDKTMTNKINETVT